MSLACLLHCRQKLKLPDGDWTFPSIINNTFIFRCKEIKELLSCVMILKEYMQTHPQVLSYISTYTINFFISHFYVNNR